MSLRIAVFTLALATAQLAAQGCPDQIVSRQPTRQVVGPIVACSQVQLAWRNVQIGQGVNGCPTFVLIIPEYDAPASRPGSNTFVRPAGLVGITQLVFSCDLSYLLFIPLGSTCTLARERVIGHRVNYEQLPCSMLPVSATTASTRS